MYYLIFRPHPTCITALLLFLLCSCGIPQTNFFVAPDGNNQNQGTLEEPFASLEKARDAVREARKQDVGKSFTIHLREGAYPRDQSFVLQAIDSGAQDNPLVITAYQDEKATVHGGYQLAAGDFIEVTDTAVLARIPESGRSHVKQIDLQAAGIEDYGALAYAGMGLPDVVPAPELFINGRAMTLARWPNEGYAVINKVIDPGTLPRHYQPDIPPGSVNYVPPEERDDPWRGFTFRFDNDRLANWANAEDAWMFGYWYWDWADGIVKIDSIDLQQQTIKSEQASWYSARDGQRFYVFNLLEELDQPGEWYLDRSSGILYLYPPEQLESTSIQLSVLDEPLMVLDNASHVKIENLTLEVSRGHGVHIKGGQNNLVAGCTLRRLGQKAVVIGEVIENDDELAVNPGKEHGVLSCDIYDTGKGGIQIGGGNRKTLEAAGHYAVNNHIHDYSRIRKTYTEAIQIYGVGIRAEHNLIHDAPHAAILFRGNEHTIQKNEIHNVCQEADDAGAIYTGRDWTYRGNVLNHNYIHHVGGIDGNIGVFGIYLDDAMSSVEAQGNVFYKVWRAFHIGGGRDHQIVNNVIIEGKESINYDDRAYRRDPWFAGSMDEEHGTLFVRLRNIPYQQEPWASRYPQLVDILDGDPGIPTGSLIKNNVIYQTEPMNLAHIVRQESQVGENLVIDEEMPQLFVDSEAQNFTIASDAPVYESLPGFEDIPFNEIGLYSDAYRTKLE